MTDPLDTARQMWADDPASRALGMELRDLGPGRAVVEMTVRPDMVNGHAVAHGGLVAALADSAFALACNSRGTADRGGRLRRRASSSPLTTATSSWPSPRSARSEAGRASTTSRSAATTQ